MSASEPVGSSLAVDSVLELEADYNLYSLGVCCVAGRLCPDWLFNFGGGGQLSCQINVFVIKVQSIHECDL